MSEHAWADNIHLAEMYQQENKRLAALNADLLTALQGALFAMSSVAPTVELAAAKHRARKAIAKATGTAL